MPPPGKRQPHRGIQAGVAGEHADGQHRRDGQQREANFDEGLEENREIFPTPCPMMNPEMMAAIRIPVPVALNQFRP